MGQDRRIEDKGWEIVGMARRIWNKGNLRMETRAMSVQCREQGVAVMIFSWPCCVKVKG